MGIIMKKKLLSFGLFLILISIITGCSTTSNYYKSGKKCFVSGNYEEAALNFSLAITENPNRADYYIDYGMTLIALGQYEEAIVQLDLAYIEKDIKMMKENNKRIHRGKGIAYYYMLQYQDSIQQFDLALQFQNELSELDMDILYYKGSSLMMIGSYEQSADAYTDLLSINKNDTAALTDRAYIYRNLGEYEKGLADYNMAITLKPNSFNYYLGKYYLMVDNGQATEAAEVLKQAADIVVKTKEDKYNLAKIHYYQGSYEEALKEFNEGFANGFAEAYFYIGEIKREQKEYEKAIYYYEMYIEKGEVLNPAVYNQLGSSLMKSGDFKKAIKYLEKGIEYSYAGMMRVLMKNEIIAYENLGMFDVALEKLQKYLSSYPNDIDAQREEGFLETRLVESESRNP